MAAGNPTLFDDLLARRYQSISVLDISQTAVGVNKKRLGSASEHIRWLVADITKAKLKSCAYDVWHDRAVFHFLTAPALYPNLDQTPVTLRITSLTQYLKSIQKK